MNHALDQHYTWTKKLIDQQSSSSKFGRRVKFKKEFAEVLRQNLTYGDYSQGKRLEYELYHDLETGPGGVNGVGDGQWSHRKPKHNVAADAPVIAVKEISQRQGEKIYGEQLPDMALVTDEMDKNNSLLVGGDRTGFNSYECGLWQAGHDRINWGKGPQSSSDYNNHANKVTHDHVRATTISAPMKSYAPSEMWIGSGFAPGSKHMKAIPFHV